MVAAQLQALSSSHITIAMLLAPPSTPLCCGCGIDQTTRPAAEPTLISLLPLQHCRHQQPVYQQRQQVLQSPLPPPQCLMYHPPCCHQFPQLPSAPRPPPLLPLSMRPLLRCSPRAAAVAPSNLDPTVHHLKPPLPASPPLLLLYRLKQEKGTRVCQVKLRRRTAPTTATGTPPSACFAPTVDICSCANSQGAGVSRTSNARA